MKLLRMTGALNIEMTQNWFGLLCYRLKFLGKSSDTCVAVASTEKSGACIDLQWFAKAEDEGRTEEASEHKIRKAREEGRVAKSQELNSGLVLLFPIIALIICAPWVYTNCIKVIKFYFDRCVEAEFSDKNLAIAFFIQILSQHGF